MESLTAVSENVMATNDVPEWTISSRRKACDLCFAKKIKCDMMRPVCSNCILYQAPCTMGIKKRKTNPAKRTSAQISQDAPNTPTDNLEARITRIEHRLDKSDSNSSASLASAEVVRPYREIERNSTLGTVDPDLTIQQSSQRWSLPPREESLYYVDCFFRHLNNAMPLFDQSSFMQVFEDWYGNTETHTSVRWAFLQIGLALGVRASRFETGNVKFGLPSRTNSYLSNAQSVLPDLVTHDEDLLGLQTLLGIVILLQNRSDQKPGSAILASAMRLVHRLELHAGSPDRRWSSSDALQRYRVFWIAYMLDKETSLRVKTPSFQFNNDIDVPLPPMVSKDGVGLLRTVDGRKVLNYFRLRVELAYIHGIIYDLLYSARASRANEQERNRRVAHIHAKLNQWYEGIPVIFQMDHLASVVGPAELVQVTRMHHSFLIAKVMAHGFYSRDAAWIRGNKPQSAITIDDLVLTQDHFGAARGSTGQNPPSQQGWEELVYISRGCMKLFHATSQIESLIWQCGCGHSSALMILLANMFLNPNHPFIELDRHLCNKSIDLFDDTIKTTNDKAFAAVRKIVKELARMADEATVPKEAHGKEIAPNQSLFDFDETNAFELQDWNFDPFEERTWVSLDDFSVDELERSF